MDFSGRLTAAVAGAATAGRQAAEREELGQRYRAVRQATERFCEPLEVEDFVIQSMPDCSPTKWHLAHTSWFFEAFILAEHAPNYRSPHPQFAYLFNSYYVQAGERHCRPKRGLISRPTVAEVYQYRQHVDQAMTELLESLDDDRLAALAPTVIIGLNHEQQHQELMVTDLKHMLSTNPLQPVYRERPPERSAAPPLRWLRFEEGIHEIGHAGGGFFYDNEGPRHRELVPAFELASRPVTCGDYLEFIADGGYERPELWLSEGWNLVETEGWGAPLYWWDEEGRWTTFTLSGRRPVEPSEPVTHVSYFEADAYARWAGAWLPTEAQWEVAATGEPITGNFVESARLHPAPLNPNETGLTRIFGDVWEWTASSYLPYPGYRAAPGALGEYNGKFMVNQMVLRGGSCATSASHIRATYRNFFHTAARWQFNGIRLARPA